MYYKFFVLSLFLLAFIFGCGDDNSSNPAKTAQITCISPTSGYVGDAITITGTNFGTTQGTSFVTFNITKATEIISWSDTQIKVKVPSGATTGIVSITTNEVKSNEVFFKLLILPDILQITKIVPDSAYIEDNVTITGIGFGQNQNTSIVYFNGTKAIEYTIWNDTLIKLKVPVGATSGKVSAIVNGTKSNEVFFKVLINVDPKTCAIKWMAKNLAVDHYRNGDLIPEVTDPTKWTSIITGAWCNYNNDPAKGAIYGKLYNWYAVNDPRGLAPVGYHIPTDAEWKELEMCLGMSQSEADKTGRRGTDEGGKFKEAGTAHWLSPNNGATNSSGFSGLPGGYRGVSGIYNGVREGGSWWSSTESAQYPWQRGLNYSHTDVGRGNDADKKVGFSVRCVRD